MKKSNKLLNYQFKLFFTTLFILVVISFVITNSFKIGYGMTSKYTPLVDATMEIKLEATMAHLWFEEILSGDRSSSIDAVHKNINNAIWYAKAMIDGGTNEEGIFLPLENKELENKIRNVLNMLQQFKDVTDERYNYYKKIGSGSGAGSEYDQQYDHIFESFINESDIVETELQKIIFNELKSYELTYYSLMIGSLLFIIIIALLLNYYEKEKINNLLLIKESENRLLKSLEIIDSNVLTFELGIDRGILSVSDAFCKMFSYKKRELIGKSYDTLCYSDANKKKDNELWSRLNSGSRWAGELEMVNKDGKKYFCNSLVTPSFNENGQIDKYVFISENITDKKIMEKLSITDVLTQLFNRLYIDNLIEQEIKRATRYKGAFSIIFIDIDHFKEVNDTYGHDVGDSVLVEVSKILKSQIRNLDVVGRWGGEEFMIVCPETDKNSTYILAEKLRKFIENHSFKTVKHITCSFGVCEFKFDEEPKTVMKRVDDALYKAKKSGRNRVVSN